MRILRTPFFTAIQRFERLPLNWRRDGKSAIFEQLLDYLEWRYGTPSVVYNVDETTTSAKLAGGFSPMSFATKEKVIRYGVISRALLKRNLEIGGELVGMGANVMLDEINRTDFENISFLMGYFENPHKYLLEEDMREFLNPNHRIDFNREYRWVFTATMNISDVGNQALSDAFKSRFHIIRIRYKREEILAILRSLFKLGKYEIEIFLKLNNTIDSWKKASEIKFPCGIRHYSNFFKFLRNGVADIIDISGTLNSVDDLKIGKSPFYLRDYIEEVLRSTIMMPIINENRPDIVASKDDQIIQMANDYALIIFNFLTEKFKELTVMESAFESLESTIY